MVVKCNEKKLVELKMGWILYHDLPDTVQELGHDWRGFPGFSRQMTTPKVQKRAHMYMAML